MHAAAEPQHVVQPQLERPLWHASPRRSSGRSGRRDALGSRRPGSPARELEPHNPCRSGHQDGPESRTAGSAALPAETPAPEPWC